MLLQRISFENMFLYYFAKCYLHCICILIPGFCVCFLVCKCNHTGSELGSTLHTVHLEEHGTDKDVGDRLHGENTRLLR